MLPLAPARSKTRQSEFSHALSSQRENDPESSLMHYRARSYDPRTGRFVQKDSLFSNRISKHYAYGSNRPSLNVDPSGCQDLPSGKNGEVWFPNDNGWDLIAALDQNMPRYQDDATAAANAKKVNKGHEGWGPVDKGSGLLYGQPTAAGLKGTNFLEVLRTSLVADPGTAKTDAIKFVRTNSKYFFPSMDSLFQGDLKDKRLVVVTHGSPVRLGLSEGDIMMSTDLTKQAPTWNDLTLIACDLAGDGDIGTKMRRELKKPVYGVAGKAVQVVRPVTSFDETTSKKFSALIEDLRSNRVNYFTFEQKWEELYKASKKNGDDYAYWDVYIDDFATKFKDMK